MHGTPFLPCTGKARAKSCVLPFSSQATADLPNLENKQEVKAVRRLGCFLEDIYSDFPTSELIGWAPVTDIPGENS